MTNTMSYKGYTATMAFDTEGKIIVGRVQGIDDIIAFHGESVAEFESNFHAAIEDYLAAAKALDSAPEKPASGKLMLRIAPEVHAAALKAAAKSGTSRNKWAESVMGREEVSSIIPSVPPQARFRTARPGSGGPARPARPSPRRRRP